MRGIGQNSFNGGMNADAHPLVVQSNQTIDALNMELTTVGEDQYILQNIPGNVKEFNLSPGYIPLAVEIFNEIAYIISAKFDSSGVFMAGELGTFPSPDWSKQYTEKTSALFNVYSPLHNFLTDEYGDIVPDEDYLHDEKHTMPFRTASLAFNLKDFIDLTLQLDYDRTINYIFTDDRNPIRLINSGFILQEDGTILFADRSASKDSNTYSTKFFDAVDLMLTTETVPDLQLDQVTDTGQLPGGGYRYYFRYKTQEGENTDIIEESRLVSIFRGAGKSVSGVSDGEITNKAVQFSLTNLDPKYSLVEVLYTYSSGDLAETGITYRIMEDFKIADDNSVIIKHSGFENTEVVADEFLNEISTSITAAKTIEQINDRLVIGNVTSSNNTELIEKLMEVSRNVKIVDTVSKNIEGTYTYARHIYNNLNYWPGETYELGIVYILKSGITPVFPIRGIDNMYGDALYTGKLFSGDELIDFDPTNNTGTFENVLGIHRTYNNPEISDDISIYKSSLYHTKLSVDVSALFTSDIRSDVIGYYIVRKERIKDVIHQGYLGNTIKVPTTNRRISEAEFVSFERNTSFFDEDDTARYIGQTSNMSYPTHVKYDALNVTFDFTHLPAPISAVELMGIQRSRYVGGLISPSSVGSFYSPDLDVDAQNTVDLLDYSIRGVEFDPGVQGYTEHTIFNRYKDNESHATYVHRIRGLSMQTGDTHSAELRYVQNGSTSYSDDSLSSKCIATLSYIGKWRSYGTSTKKDLIKDGVDPYKAAATGSYKGTGSGNNVVFYGMGINNTAAWRLNVPPSHAESSNWLYPYESIVANYTQYIGVKFTSKIIGRFTYTDYEPPLDFFNSTHVKSTRVGYLANVLSGSRRRSRADLYDIYNQTDKSQYFAVSKRMELGSVYYGRVPLSDGDCFVDWFSKKITYPIGIEEAPTANAGDVIDYGVGPYNYYDESRDSSSHGWDDSTAQERTDRGRQLMSQGYIIQFPVRSSHNFRLRSLEFADPLETELFGKRSFHPLLDDKESRSIYAPETKKYNHGYSGTHRIISYSAIDPSAPVSTQTYQNRVVISAPNIPNEFSNGYRDIRGINFKDYNSELGSITKLINHNNILYCIFEDGIGILTVDGRTLVNRESDIYVDDAQVLASKQQILSSKIGSINPESITASYSNIYGVDIVRNKIWKGGIKGIEFISDFAIQSILDYWKARLELPGVPTYDGGMEDHLGYKKIYGSIDAVKKTVHFSYNKLLKEPNNAVEFFLNAGNIYYSEIARAWVSKVSAPVKFAFQHKARIITLSPTLKEHSGWVSDTNPIYCNFYGVQFDNMFEYVMHERPDAEKILTNINLMSNKVKPREITYEITGDYTDATIEQFAPVDVISKIFKEKIKTRKDSFSKNIGIFNENAYYKDGKYLIQVGKNASFSRFHGSARRIRDKYFKIKIEYSGKQHVWIYSTLAQFTINYN